MRTFLSVLILSVASFAQGGMMPGPGTVHSIGPGATAALVQKVASPSCGGATTCAGTIVAIGAGHSAVFVSESVSVVVMASVSTGGTLVPCGGGVANTGGNITGSGGLSIQCGWILSTTASSTTLTLTYSGTTGGAAWTMYEYSCTGGTVSHDQDNATQNGTDTTPFNGVTLSGLTGTNDFIVQAADGTNNDPSSVAGPYGDFLLGNNGLAAADLLNTTSGTAPVWTAAGNTAGKFAQAIAMKCQ